MVGRSLCALTFSALDDEARFHVSGLLDLEGYKFDQPAPGLLYTESDALLNTRLTLFVDSQIGPQVYAFAQARMDRGFDPSDEEMEMRLDEYAVRFTPWEDGRLNLQIWKFGTTVGQWVSRHLSWENPFVTAPLPYELIYDSEAPASPHEFLDRIGEAEYDYSPLIWGASYTTGASVSGQLGELTYAAEVKNVALAAHTESWYATAVGFDHPTFSGRLGYRPNEMWNTGISFSDGPYFHPDAEPTLPSGSGIDDFHQTIVGQDISFAWHHLQLWAECYQGRFEVPNVGNADTLAYFVEAKYKFGPQLYGALRWNQQLFEDVSDGEGGREHWGNDLWRADAAVGYRLNAYTQLKLQYSHSHEASDGRGTGNLLAAQVTVRF